MPATSLLIAIAVPFFRRDGRLYVERQACNGLRLWSENFDRVEVIARESGQSPPVGWIPWDDSADWAKRISFRFLPEAFRPDQFLRALPAARAKIRTAIEQNSYLCFAIGGLFGDWGSVAAHEAIAMGRPYSIWTDRVESDVVRRTMSDGTAKARIMARLTHRPMAALERRLVRNAALGLFHGADTYEAYAPYSPYPVLVHDVHLSRADEIMREALAAKQAGIAAGIPHIVYAGRMAAMKGWSDWLAVLSRLRREGMRFEATWLGDGADRPAFLRDVDRLGLSDVVSAPGNVDDRVEVKRRLEEAHMLLFCHKTKESPRILIEALRAGTPIVGYGGAFARDLVSGSGGGVLTPQDDVAALAEAVLSLDRDRERWAGLMEKAREDGSELYDEAVFRHRSEVIKSVLDPVRQETPRNRQGA